MLKIDSIDQSVNEISSALRGNPSLGTVGLASRIEQVEREVQDHERKLVKWGSSFAVLVVLVEVLVVWGPKLLYGH